MQFKHIVLHWKGKITNVEVHNYPGSTVTIATAATWPRLILTCVKQGALVGALVGAFLGAIEGFKQEGIPGALKGMAIGGLVGGGIGAIVTPTVALLSRILPCVATAATILGFVATVAGIVLAMPSETTLDPQEFHPGVADDDGNLWYARNVRTVGTLFPEQIPQGIKVECADGRIFQFGEELARESAYNNVNDRTPICVCGKGHVQWAMQRTPEGSSMWWWKEGFGQEYAMFFHDDQAMAEVLSNFSDEEKQLYELTEN